MPASFEFQQDTGAATGTPARGTNRNTGITAIRWKDADDVLSNYQDNPIVAGNASYDIYLFGRITGTFTEVRNGLFGHTAGAFGTGITLKGLVSSNYQTPSNAVNANLTVDMTATDDIANGEPVLFSTTGPEDQSPVGSINADGYTQYLITQLQTTDQAAGGDTTEVTLTLQYDEN